ncbi:M24 family metallopeptidase [Umezawaea endophytica]|uniref:M24 family metallopeptidase n=1 Tax=Umezawaea endophytica TaxID=1654476 RepID=A0A9X2VU66_9PSEU|nr:M24 family metallopeptidase [Umezawaea endophytica]MCS7482883.1 M24 family metallopeptidase [Umezawaea endophytica]
MNVDERDWRWARVREEMTKRDIDLVIALPESNPTDARYLADETGAVLFPLEGEPFILLGGEDSNLAVDREAWIERRASATPSGSTKVPYGAVVAAELRRRRPRAVRVAIAGLDGNDYSHVRSADGYVVHSTVVRILEALQDAEVVDGAPVMAAARHVKSAAEVADIRAGIEVAEAGARAIGAAFRVGAEQADAYRAGMTAMMRPGLALPSIAWCPGEWGKPRPRLVAVPRGQVADGLCVAAEIMPGYQHVVQVAEPFIAGRILPEQQDAFDLNIAAFEAARAALVPGATWREVRAAAMAVAAGTGSEICFLLHGGFDGPLFIPNDTPEAVLDDPVEEGAVFICKPTAFPRSAGRVVARSYDVSWGDMLVVRQGGAERLGTRPQVLHSRA